MKRSGVRLLSKVCCCMLVSFIVTATAWGATVESIEAIQTYIEENGLEGFTEAAASNAWEAPVIPSAWHLGTVATPGTIETGQAARALGLSLVEAIDGWVPSMHSENGSNLLEKATRLVDVAVWVGEAEGYGNFFVATRACEVAVSGLARLVADIEFPLSGTEAQIQRCRLPITSPSARARILNQESGTQVFPQTATTHDELRAAWDARVGRNTLAQGPPSDLPDLQLLLDRVRQAIASTGLNPDEPEPLASFLTDENCPAPATTANCWDRKRHEALVAGWNRLIGSLEGLVTFREAVGAFPSTPQGTSSVLSSTELAFYEAWQPFSTPGTEFLGADAATTYENIEAGEFLDMDTRLARFEAARSIVPTPESTAGSTPGSEHTPTATGGP